MAAGPPAGGGHRHGAQNRGPGQIIVSLWRHHLLGASGWLKPLYLEARARPDAGMRW